MVSTINNVRLLLLAAWLGAAIFFSAAVAPGAFRVVRALNVPNPGEVAGGIVSQTLHVVNISGFVISVFVLAFALILRKFFSRRSLMAQIVLLGLVAMATALGEWVIAARMRALRATMSMPVEQVDLSDATRVAFQSLHGYSVAALSVAIIAAFLAFFVIAKADLSLDSSRSLHS